jgi:hypothetical protein
MKELTPQEIDAINERIVTLRAQLRDTGATALTPTPEWEALRKEVSQLNRKLKPRVPKKLAEVAVPVAASAPGEETA